MIGSFEETLALVRSLLENAVTRPWGRVLRCIPVQVIELKPLPAWKRRQLAAAEKFAT
jgi:hypothetical protein